MLNLRIIAGSDPTAAAVAAYAARCAPLPDGFRRAVVLLAGPGSTVGIDQQALVADAAAGRTAVVVDAGALGSLDPGAPLLLAAGVGARPPLRPHRVRLRPGPAAGGLFARLDDLDEPLAALVALDAHAADAEVLLTAPVGLDDVAVATWRPSTNVAAVGFGAGELTGSADPGALRLLHRILARAASDAVVSTAAPSVGLLGFGAIGAEHLAGFARAGMDVTAVCDRSDQRLAAVAAAVPGVRTYAKADELLGDQGVDLVVVSSPPDSHARWAMASLEAGRHTVVEKPLALTAADADGMLDAAARAGLLLSVYQNRRFDPDFLALQRVVRAGRLGRVFHLEAFVGGHGHPCNYWHSDAAVSGGTGFDWGSHYLDQILAVVDGPLESVRGSEHKLRWHDVTNADQVRVQLRFVDGTEVDFVHSDLAAALKPKWYVLGTDGAAVGEWRRERVVARSSIGTLVDDELAPADSPATVWLHDAEGSRTELAQPSVVPGRYHRELADRLLLGEPMTPSAEQSRDVVAILEAAARSAADRGAALPCPLRGR